MSSNNILRPNKMLRMMWTGDTTEYVTKGKVYKILNKHKESLGNGKFAYSYSFIGDDGVIDYGMSMLFVSPKRKQ